MAGLFPQHQSITGPSRNEPNPSADSLARNLKAPATINTVVVNRSHPSSGKLRPKPQLSCNICRLRKVKCNRKQPCDTCTSHGYAASCEYPKANPTKKQAAAQKDVISKLNQLESLVHSLRSERPLPAVSQQSNEQSSGQHRVHPSPEAGNALSNTFGRLSLDHSDASYVGSDHWAAIIDGIADLKNHFEDTSQPPVITHLNPSTCGEDGPEIFHGHVRFAQREEIIASMPSKDIVDALVFRYFDQHDQVPVFLHKPTFLKEYDLFWRDVNDASITWIGLLYCVMCLGSRFQSSYESGRCGSSRELLMLPLLWQVQEYREKAVQCLLAGNYIKPGKYTVETLLLYFLTEHLQHTDAQFGNWILMGQITRIAMRLGLHRDPSHTSKVSAFSGEMRRRLWTAIVQVDLTTSIQMGLPKMISESYCDTREPLNFLDEDLDEDMDELPEPRPDSILTPILYIRTRNKLLSVFAKISDKTTSVQPSSYAEAWELDSELLEARSAIPDGLQLRPLCPALADRHDIMIFRIYLDTTFQHARCMLHRKYLIPSRSNDQYTQSRVTCIEAALALLHHQQVLELETNPGGQFEHCRWKLSSLYNHEMLLAATVLCVELNQDLEEGLINDQYWEKNNRREILDALRSARRVFLQSWSVSAESRKGATAIGVVLDKAGVVVDSDHGQNTVHGSPTQQLFPPQTPSWSLQEILSPGFPQFQAWNVSQELDEEMYANFSG